MFSIKPRENFPIVRGLPDHTDTGTYYVRAVIRKANDSSLLDTVNLDDKGGRYFSKNWEAPADVSGEGFYISITTSVYTDSGYTTKADMYADEFQTYLIADRPNTAQILGGGGGSDISYKKVEEIVSRAINEAINGLPKAIEPKEVDFSNLEENLMKEITNIVNKIDSIKIPESEKLDYAKIIGAIGHQSSQVMEKIDSINIPEVDYEQINNKFNELNPLMDGLVGKINKIIDDLKNNSSKIDGISATITTLNKIKSMLSETLIGEEKKVEEIIKPSYRGNK